MDILQIILRDYTLRIVALGSGILGIISGVVGSFAVIRKESLIGDSVSHSALLGIALVFLITQTKTTEFLLFGALMSGLAATFLILFIVRYSRIKFDSALALVLSVFFGGGIALLTYIQKIPNANQAGLDKFIFGQASTLLKREVWMMGVLGIIIITLIIIFWKEFKIISFDPEFAESIGFSVKKITMILSGITVATIVVGLQTVGVILMSSMLIAPAVAARQWTDKLSVMVILSAMFGAISGILGTILSSIVSELPTGPMIVMVISVIVMISLSFSPNRGLIWKYFKERKNQKEISEDKILINLYNLAMNHKELYHGHEISAIKPYSAKVKGESQIVYILQNLSERNLVQKDIFDKWKITKEGIKYVQDYFGKEEE